MIRQHVRSGQSVLVTGPTGSGKSTLLRALYGSWTPERQEREPLYAEESRTPRVLLRHLLANLLLSRGRLEGDEGARIASIGELSRFVANADLHELVALAYRNVSRDRVVLVLDHLDPAHPKAATMIEAWLEHGPVVLGAQRAVGVGRVRCLLPSDAQLGMRPLDTRSIHGIIENLSAELQLSLDAGDVTTLTRLAAGNPGRLCLLMRTATNPRYRTNGGIQWRLVALDVRIREIGDGDQPSE